ncbi:MAG: cytochrome C [Acidobacteria bacterium]|nr:MAG: cytochrome C [Acidobacteriota bacterium]
MTMFKTLFRSLGNRTSLVGAAITTASAVLIITMFVLEQLGFIPNPYIGIVTYLILPAIFGAGLLLIPIGIVLHRRSLKRRVGVPLPTFPVIDLNRARTRAVAVVVLLLTVVNIVIISTATVKGVHVMDSTEFCGSCHSVMEPEYTAYQRSPHARVKCVTCHIGPGADWFVKSKLSGSWQVVATALDLYPRPIPTPVHSLRPARDTCEQCHWPSKFVGDRLKRITRFDTDEKNTELTTMLLLRVGGTQGANSHGIHWHVDPGITVRYLADAKRQTIYEVELMRADGSVKRFRGPEPPPDGTELEWRVMDCIDCHNRPTHIYGTPEDEISRAIVAGDIPRDLPFIVREGIRALRTEYPSHEAARAGIAEQITSFYRENYPRLFESARDAIERAASALGDIYCRNVFPSMKVTWGTYPDNLGHESSPGCFRCHDDEHATEDGETISGDCDLCHAVLAMEEENPEILAALQP